MPTSLEEIPERTTVLPRRWRAADVWFVAVLSGLHASLWWWANHREGVWLQGPATDQAHDLTTAWLFHRALLAVDPDGLARTWVAGSSVHTPFVPFCSALVMRLAGANRVAAESVLPLFAGVWIAAVYGCVRRLFDPALARVTTMLMTAFPVFLIYSRTYVFEQPLAAMFAVACWSLIACDGFRRFDRSLAFGVAAGLVALTRGGGFVLLTGPVIAALWPLRHTHGRRRRLLNCAGALALATLLALTWYGPNFGAFSDYVRQATYGRDAMARTGTAGAFSWNAALYYVTWLIAQGPGWPMLLTAAAAGVLALGRPPRARRPSPVAAALGAVFAIDFFALLLGMQRQTARYFLPLMPLVALAIAGTVRAVPWRAARNTLAAIVAVLALHHVVALSLTFTAASQAAAAPYVHGVPLWDHRTYFRSLVDFYKLRTPRDDFRIPEIVQFLATLPIGAHATIAVASVPHGFFHRNGLQLESIRQQREWRWPPDIYVLGGAAPADGDVAGADAVLVRWGGASSPDRDEMMRVVPAVATRFQAARDFTLGDGSVVTVFVRVSESTRGERSPAALLPRCRRSLFSIARSRT